LSVMKNLIRKFFFLSIFAVSILGLVYTLVLYAGRQIDGLQALFCTDMAMLSILWFAFQLRQAGEDWPISIRPRREATMIRSEQRDLWIRRQQQAA